MPFLLVGLAVGVLLLAAVAARGDLGDMPEPPVEDDWLGPGPAGSDHPPAADLPHAG